MISIGKAIRSLDSSKAGKYSIYYKYLAEQEDCRNRIRGA